MYKLTIPEIRQLYNGYQLREELADDKAKGISQGDRKGLAEFNDRLNSPKS